VTILALKFRVLSTKWILGHRVIKVIDLPIPLGMTFRTIAIAESGSELPGMLILVTRKTLILLESRPMILRWLPFGIMALGTLDLVVLPKQFILGISLVIELQIILPGLHAVALGTIFLGPFTGKMVNVIFLMASNTA
jgi:hypothetical protein